MEFENMLLEYESPKIEVIELELESSCALPGGDSGPQLPGFGNWMMFYSNSLKGRVYIVSTFYI